MFVLRNRYLASTQIDPRCVPAPERSKIGYRSKNGVNPLVLIIADFCNKISHSRRFGAAAIFGSPGLD